ncbi:hypothetical protein DBR45_05485 [Pseudomonas sp. HMWF031]|nr:hypothetical protein DBR45_05485 [Pseudomonas sp. HMWF031]
MRIMLGGNKLDTFKQQSSEIKNAKPIFESDLKDNVESATGAGARMKATLGEAIDRMAKPLNKGFADFGSYLLDDLNLSGEQLLAGGVATGVGGYYAGRGVKAGAGALINKFMGGPETLKNIAVGKVLEEATGVTSVFVTNWPSEGITPAIPDLNSKSTKVIPAAPLGIVSLAAIAAVTSGSSENTDEGRLRAAQNSKLDDDGQKAYKTSFYKNRIELAKSNPDASSDWLSSQAQQLARDQTGLTAAGTSAAGAVSWAQNAANRLTQAGIGPLQQGADNMAEQRLRSLVDKPLVLELRLNSEMVQAEVERRTDIQVRRGN